MVKLKQHKIISRPAATLTRNKKCSHKNQKGFSDGHPDFRQTRNAINQPQSHPIENIGTGWD